MPAWGQSFPFVSSHTAPSSRSSKRNHISGTLTVASQHLHRKRRVCFPPLSAANMTQKQQWACSRRRTHVCASICLQTTTTVRSMWLLVDSSGFDLVASFWSEVIDYFSLRRIRVTYFCTFLYFTIQSLLTCVAWKVASEHYGGFD